MAGTAVHRAPLPLAAPVCCYPLITNQCTSTTSTNFSASRHSSYLSANPKKWHPAAAKRIETWRLPTRAIYVVDADAGIRASGVECRETNGGNRVAGVGRWKYSRACVVRRPIILARSTGGGERTGAEQLTGQEFFESFLRRRKANGDFVSRVADVLWKREVIEFDEENRRRVQQKISELQKMKEIEDNGSFLKLSQARNWSLGQDAAPVNPNNTAMEREILRSDRKKQSLLEYEALKREISLMTAGVGVSISAYCFISLSSEATVSYAIGTLASLWYLQLLYRHVDNVSEDNVASIFLQRRRKRAGITGSDIQSTIERTLQGISRALSSPRLVIPIALFGLSTFSSDFTGNFPVHLEVTPLILGFFAYKGAALLQAYRDNKDLLVKFPESVSKGPNDK